MTRKPPPLIIPPGSIPAVTPPGTLPRPVLQVPTPVFNPHPDSTAGSPGKGPGFALFDHSHPAVPSTGGGGPKWQASFFGEGIYATPGSLQVFSWSEDTSNEFGSVPSGIYFSPTESFIFPSTGVYAVYSAVHSRGSGAANALLLFQSFAGNTSTFSGGGFNELFLYQNANLGMHSGGAADMFTFAYAFQNASDSFTPEAAYEANDGAMSETLSAELYIAFFG